MRNGLRIPSSPPFCVTKKAAGWDENPFGEPLGEQAMPEASGEAWSEAEPIPSSPPLFYPAGLLACGQVGKKEMRSPDGVRTRSVSR